MVSFCIFCGIGWLIGFISLFVFMFVFTCHLSDLGLIRPLTVCPQASCVKGWVWRVRELSFVELLYAALVAVNFVRNAI